MYLCVTGFLRSPFLYLSLFFKQNRDLYYEKLSEPRKTGDWEAWINFFLEGVAETAINAKKRSGAAFIPILAIPSSWHLLVEID